MSLDLSVSASLVRGHRLPLEDTVIRVRTVDVAAKSARVYRAK